MFPSLVRTPGSQHVPESQPSKALTALLQAVTPQRLDIWWGDCPETFILECLSGEAVRMLRKTRHGPCARVIRNAKHLHWGSWEKKAASSLALGYMAVKVNLLPETTVHSPADPACCLASLMIFFPGLPPNKGLMASVCLRHLFPVPLLKSSALCLSTRTDFYFAKQSHPSARTLVFSTPLQPAIPKSPVPSPSP